MDYVTILAEAVETAAETQAAQEAIVPIDLIWEHITSLGLLEALTFISFGAVCLFYGWRVFKILVIISFALLGLALGVFASEKINGEDHQLIGGLVGLVLMAVMSVPLMRWAVSILGAVAGGTMTAGLWYAAKLPEEYIWAGGLIGIVAGGMISFIVFKIAVMLFSSLGGSTLIVTGALAILYLYPETTEKVRQLVFDEKWFLPTILLVPAFVGIVIQNKFVKGSKDWGI
jgi:hypothetical protein